MGSGSSKEKAPKKSGSHQKKDPNDGVKNGNDRNQKVSSIGVTQDSDIGYTNKINTTATVNNNIKDKSSKNISQSVNDTTRTKGGSNAPPQKLGSFNSDSESETEDINEVLEATRREHEERVKEQNYYNSRQNEPTSYPETYAHRLQREQYRPELGIIRQKTIYRNPDEWKVEEDEQDNERGFDVDKFKQANAVKQVQSVQDRDIFSPSEKAMPSTRNQGQDPDSYYTPVLQKQKSIPKYDLSEEALLAEIEKEYEF